MPYRIQRSVDRDAIVFRLSGDLDRQHTSQLEELLAIESGAHILLDLTDVTFADRDGVRFLARAECARIQIVNCPEYVRSWIVAENAEM